MAYEPIVLILSLSALALLAGMFGADSRPSPDDLRPWWPASVGIGRPPSRVSQAPRPQRSLPAPPVPLPAAKPVARSRAAAADCADPAA